ncbi:hypothetical protein Tco_1221980, partial [Tanacetum coccineum]
MDDSLCHKNGEACSTRRDMTNNGKEKEVDIIKKAENQAKMTKLRVFTIRAILDNNNNMETRRLFRVAMLDPSQGFIDPWGKFGDLELPSV